MFLKCWVHVLKFNIHIQFFCILNHLHCFSAMLLYTLRRMLTNAPEVLVKQLKQVFIKFGVIITGSKVKTYVFNTKLLFMKQPKLILLVCLKIPIFVLFTLRELLLCLRIFNSLACRIKGERA